MKKLTILTIFFTMFSQFAFAAQGNRIDNKQIAEFIDKTGQKIISIAKNDNKFSEQKMRQEIIKVVEQSIDAPWIAKFVLSKNYRTANAEQRQKFQDFYREFLINTYGPKFKDYNGKKFTVLSVEDNKRFYLVRCEFLPKNSNVAIKTDFRVKAKENGDLAIIDFIAEGVSLLETHRSEFDSAIAQKGLDGFLNDLKNRVNMLKNTSSNK